jgi:transposase
VQANNRKSGTLVKRPRQTRRHFTHEFKLEAVRLADGSDRPLNEIAHELGIRPNVLRQWRRQAAARAGQPGQEIFPGQGRFSSRDEEVRRLKREVAHLQEERDILKKAAAFFARTTR